MSYVCASVQASLSSAHTQSGAFIIIIIIIIIIVEIGNKSKIFDIFFWLLKI